MEFIAFYPGSEEDLYAKLSVIIIRRPDLPINLSLYEWDGPILLGNPPAQAKLEVVEDLYQKSLFPYGIRLRVSTPNEETWREIKPFWSRLSRLLKIKAPREESAEKLMETKKETSKELSGGKCPEKAGAAPPVLKSGKRGPKNDPMTAYYAPRYWWLHQDIKQRKFAEKYQIGYPNFVSWMGKARKDPKWKIFIAKPDAEREDIEKWFKDFVEKQERENKKP